MSLESELKRINDHFDSLSNNELLTKLLENGLGKIDDPEDMQRIESTDLYKPIDGQLEYFSKIDSDYNIVAVLKRYNGETGTWESCGNASWFSIGWKDVAKELPKSHPSKRVSYLCYNGHDMFVAEWREYATGPAFDNYFGDVTHWMQLPEKPGVVK